MKRHLPIVYNLLLLFSFSPVVAFAQYRPDTLSVRMYPPEAASLMTYTDYPVSYMTGTPEISIPLYTIKSGTLELPVTLQFHLGDYLRANQAAGVVGAGWSLSTDFVVTRKIKGLDDLNANGYLHKGSSITEQEDYWNVTRKMALGILDGEPDRYYFKTLDGTGNFYVLNNGQKVEQVPSGPEKIEYSTDSYPSSNDRFLITDGKGREYYYSGETTTADYTESEDRHWTTWHCRKISDDTGKDVINFSYQSGYGILMPGLSSGVTICDSLSWYVPGQWTPLRLKIFNLPRLETGTHDYPYFLYPDLNSSSGYKWAPDSTYYTKEPFPDPSSVSSHLVQTISFRGGYLTFTYSSHYRTMSDGTHVDYFNVLDEIQVCTLLGVPVHTYSFEHNADMTDRYNVYLSGLTIDGTAHYRFTNPQVERGIGSTDFWGYELYDRERHINPIDCKVHIAPGLKNLHNGLTPDYNQAALDVDNLTSSIYKTEANDITFAIQYPTGGSTSFTFEYDCFYDSLADVDRKISTRRIKRIVFSDTGGGILKDVRYGYSNGRIIHYPSGRYSTGSINTILTQRLDVYTTERIYDTDNNPIEPGLLGSYRRRGFLAGTVFSDEFTSGNWINYPEVTETVVKGETPMVKTAFKYDIEGPYNSPGIVTHSSETAPYPIEKHYWYTGTQKEVSQYGYNNGTYNLLKKTEYVWDCYLKDSTIRIARIWPSVQALNLSGDVPVDASQYAYSVQHLDLGHNRLMQERTTEWMDDGASMITLKEYKYDNPDSMTIGRVISHLPDGKIQTEVFVHENDYSPLVDIGKRPTYLTEYVRFVNGMVAEGWAYEREGSRIYRVFTLDSNNLSSSYFKLSSKTTAGIFDGGGTATTEMALDSHYSQFDRYQYDTAFHALSLINRRGQADANISWSPLDMYPASITIGSHTTNATYLPLVGMTSMTTPEGIVSEYTYNQYGRLIRTEKDDNTLTEYWYSMDTTSRPGTQWIKLRSYLNDQNGFYADDLTWYNGIGLPVQKIEMGSNKDLIQPISYDGMLRDDARIPLPVPSSNLSHRTSYSSTLPEQIQYYQSLYGFTETLEAYYGREYESSPLGRLRAEWEPGTMGLASSQLASKRTTYTYVTNYTGEVRRMYHIPEGSLIAVSDYPAGALKCVVKTDPDGHTLRTYTDGLGRIVLERRNDGTHNIDTYYAYDPMGRLRWVVSPEGVSRVINQQQVSPSSDIARRYCYYYEYDNRGNVTFKQTPGSAPIKYTYDEGDRVLTMIDGNLAASGDTLKYTYDIYGRETGKDIAGTNAGIISRTSYDSYPAVAASPLVYDISHLSGLATLLQTPVGLETFSQERIFGTPYSLSRVYYYDRLGRVIQEVEFNPETELLCRTSRIYDLHNNVLREKSSTYSGGPTGSLTLKDNVETWTNYDRRDRPTELYVSFGGTSETYPPMLFFYDDLGRLSRTMRGINLYDNYTYNIQGRETDHIFVKGNSNGDTLFVSKIRYYDAFNNASSPCRNGSFSSISSLYGNSSRYTINYFYDGLNRLTRASSAGFTDSYWHYRDYLFSDMFSYDKNSNLTMEDYEFNPCAVDTEYYYQDPTYTGNHRSGYTYDPNGNITSAPGEVSSASYNLLNLPSSVTPSGGSMVTYHHSAGGDKLSVSSGTTTYIYTGPFKYKVTGNGTPVLETVNCAGDMKIERTSNGSYERRYYVKDHLGSTRLVINRSGTVLQQSDFTPYGRRINNILLSAGNSPYLWCGKEYESFIDIPWYDSEARFLTTTGVFTSTDPLCEKYYHISPYTYCAGDPINKVDPDGNWLETLWDVANVVMDVKSFVNNIKEGNALGAVVDGVATIVDVAGTMLPLIPSGAGTIIKSVRAADKVVDVSKVAKGSKTVEKAADAVKTVHGNSKLSAKAQHAYDVIDTDTGNVVKTGVSGGPINKQGKSVRAESQASKWNKQDGRNHYETRITHIEDAGEGSRAKILEYEKKRANEVRNQLDPNKHKRP